jgi:glucose-6-phosphate isomerase
LGGSVLGPKALTDSLLPHETHLPKKITYLDNLDPEDFQETLKQFDLNQTLFYVVSKSGETLETKAMLHALINFVQNKCSTADTLTTYLKKHFIFCTDPESGLLRSFCREFGLDTLDLPKNLGGRFSVISSVGLVPLCFIHSDGLQAVENFVLAALEEKSTFLSLPNESLFELAHNLHYQAVHNGKIETVFMPYIGRLKTLSLWFAQLWGESLGKIHPTHGPVGLTPLAAIGPSDQHSLLQLIAQGPKNKFVLFLKQNKINQSSHAPPLKDVYLKSPLFEQTQNLTLNDVRESCLWGTQQSLEEVEVPWCTLEIEQLSVASIAKLFFNLECLTVLLALLLEVDAFNQPGVERGKILAKEFLTNKNK